MRACRAPMMLGETGKLIAIGIAAGLMLSIAGAGSAKALLFGLEPYDIPSLSVAALLLAAVGFGASYLPALRASNADSMVALRDE